MSMTVVSVTVTDPSSQAWAKGLISYMIAGTKPIFFNGVELDDSYFKLTTVALDSSGSATFSIPDTSQMTPAGTLWRIIVNPNATAQGISLYLAITGSSMNISTEVDNAIAAPSVVPAAVPFAYDDANIIMQNGVGELYYNTGNNTGLRVYTGTVWQPVEGAGGGVPSVNGITGAVAIQAGANVTVTTNVGAGTITIAATAGSGITQLTGDVIAGPGTGSVAATGLNLHPNAATKGITWPSGDTITDTYGSDAGLAFVTLGDFNFVANGNKNENIVGNWVATFANVNLSASGTFTLGTNGSTVLNLGNTTSAGTDINCAGNCTLVSAQQLVVQGVTGLELNSGNGAINLSVNDGSTILRTFAASSVTDVTGSRSWGTSFQNTTKQMMQVSGWGITSGGSTGQLTIGFGPSFAVTRYKNENTASVSSASVGFLFVVPPGWSYEVSVSGDIGGSPGGWHEMLF